jgi:4-phospho-D-threonate 3-dehydrogenase / 4-phospho-D-erythronate 3-dehydrogenase
MTSEIRPLLGISMGDPGGIGPEICAKALSSSDIYARCRPLLVGDAEIVRDAVRFCGLDLQVQVCARPSDGSYQRGVIDVLDLENLPLRELKLGTVTAAQGKASFQYVARMIELALSGEIDGTVTAPINKAALNAGGYRYAGHTEIYADLTGTADYTMMLAEGGFRVTHVSTHVSLREACDRVTTPRVLKVIELTYDALKRLDIAQPRIAVAGLNPHCGEGGLFGTEDDREIAPAVAAARRADILAEGPLPADTLFSKLRGGLYDAVVAMYHDQGHIPTKLMGFHYDAATATWDRMAGVNLTLGLPIVRTSVDHGTAFDQAGAGSANPQSMLEAIQLGALLSRRQ